jgi:hypothetical protein
MNEQNNLTDKNLIDLGSEPNEVFDPFGSDIDPDDKTSAATLAPEEPRAETPVTQESVPQEPVSQEPKTETPTLPDSPLNSAVSTAEAKEAERPQQNIAEKLPVFEYAGATENIEDTSKTFDELRIEKAADFPELEDGKRVSWTVEYGKIVKSVADPKGMSIGKMKSDIETSKEFLDSLKKARDKNPACKVKPRVTAQSKGKTPEYKGVFPNIAEAVAAGKVISIVPAKDGNVYEIRNTKMGQFTTPAVGCELLSEVKAGFVPALPLVSADLLMKVIAFFRYFTKHGADNEVLLNIYWDTLNSEFVVDAPEQFVSKVSVDSRISENYDSSRYIHYMDIHSHNSMKAFFSSTDDNDEKATRLYTVIGELHKFIPDIKTRISNGGKFWPIDPAEVLEPIGADKQFPDEWREKVRFREPHSDRADTIGGDRREILSGKAG